MTTFEITGGWSVALVVIAVVSGVVSLWCAVVGYILDGRDR